MFSNLSYFEVLLSVVAFILFLDHPVNIASEFEEYIDEYHDGGMHASNDDS